MAITVTPNVTDLSLCESTTGWTGAGGTNSDFANQGTYCLGVQVKATTSPTIYYTPGSPIDCSGGKHIYIWVLVTGVIDTKANGGIQLYAYTDASNYGYWNVGGNDNYKGGWQCFCFDPSTGGAGGAGTVNAASIARIGIRFKTLSTMTGTAYNCFWDALRYGTGLTITSGTSDAINFASIYAVDDNSTYKYGVLTREATGSYVLRGKLTFGGTGAENVDFVATNQIILVPDNDMVSATFHGITVLRGSGTVNFTLGSKSGTSGINGNVFKAPGTRKYTLDFSSANNNSIKLYGNSFINAATITLPVAGANNEALNNNFVACSEVIASTSVQKYSNYVASAARACKISSASHAVSDSNFIGCQTAINHNVGGASGTPVEYDYDNLKFTSNTYDIENSATTPNFYIDIDRINGSNPDVAKINNSAGGTTVLLDIGVVLTLTGMIDGSDISILTAGTTTERVNIQENSGTTYNYSYSYVSSDYVDVGVFKAGYVPFYTRSYLLGSTNGSLPISQVIDRAYLE